MVPTAQKPRVYQTTLMKLDVLIMEELCVQAHVKIPMYAAPNLKLVVQMDYQVVDQNQYQHHKIIL